MKLHLPSSLRKALMACLAVFALPVSLPVTVGSGALLSFLTAQQATAADRNLNGNNQWWNAILSADNTADSTWTLETASNMFGAEDKEIFANLIVGTRTGTGLYIGASPASTETRYFTFSGKITGVGDLAFQGSNERHDDLLFRGNMSEFSGTIHMGTQGANPHYVAHFQSGSAVGDGSETSALRMYNASQTVYARGTLNFYTVVATVFNLEASCTVIARDARFDNALTIIADSNATFLGNDGIGEFEMRGNASSLTMQSNSTLTVGEGVNFRVSNGNVTTDNLATLAAQDGGAVTFAQAVTLGEYFTLETGNGGTITFSNAATFGEFSAMNASGRGSAITINGAAQMGDYAQLSVENTGTLSYGNTLTLGTNSKLNITTGGSISVNSAFTMHGGDILVAGVNSTLTLGGGGTVEDTSIELTNTGTMSVTGGLSLRAGSGLKGNTTFNLNSGTLAVDEESRLDFTGLMVVNTMNNARLSLTDEESVNGTLRLMLQGASFTEGWTYRLFTEDSYVNPDSLIFENAGLGRGMTIVCQEDGLLTLDGDFQDVLLTWQGNDRGYFWTPGSTGWYADEEVEDKIFYPGDSVLFTGSDTVDVDRNSVTVRRMTVDGNYIFTGGAISVTGDEGLIIAEEASASFQNGITATSIHAEAGARASFGGEVDMTATGMLHISEGASVTISATGNKVFSTAADQQGVALAEGATLRIESLTLNGTAVNWTGYVAGEGTLELAYKNADTYFEYAADYCELSNDRLGRIIRNGHSIAKVVLDGSEDGMTGGTVLQLTSATTQPSNFAAIQELEVARGNALVIRAGSNATKTDQGVYLGSDANTLKLAGAAQVSGSNDAVYTGALVFMVELRDATFTHFRTILNSNIELTDDATIYTHGDHILRFSLDNGNSKAGAFTSNGHTLTKTGTGTLELTKNFHTAEEEVAGGIAVKEGRVILDYTEGATLAGYHVSLDAGAQLCLSETSSSYTIGTLSGKGSVILHNNYLEEGRTPTEGMLVFSNEETERTARNTFTGNIAAGISLLVRGGYQAIEAGFTGEQNMSASHGGTLDLSNSSLAAGEENAMHLTLGTPGEEGVEENERVEGTSGRIVLDTFQMYTGATLDATLVHDSVLDMTEATIMGSTSDTTHVSAEATDGSEVILSRARIATGVEVKVALAEQSKLRMDEAQLDNGVQLELQASAGSEINLVRLQALNNVSIDLAEPGLSDGSLLDFSNATFGKNAQLGISADASTVIGAAADFAADAQLSLTLTNGSVADLSNISLADTCDVRIVAEGSDVSLHGATLSMKPLEEGDDPAAADGGTLLLDLTDGTHNLQNLIATGNARVEVELKGAAYAYLAGSQMDQGLQLHVGGRDAVVDSVQLGMGSRVSMLDANSRLTLSGNNRVILSSGMAEYEATRIFSNLELNLLDGASLNIDVTRVLSEILATAGEEKTYYIADGDLTAWKDILTFSADMALMHVKAELRADGGITFRAMDVDTDTVYISSRDNAGKGSAWNSGNDVYASMDEKVAVYIDSDTIINLRGQRMGTREDGLVLSNLMGSGTGTLYVNGDGAGKSLVTISNNLSDESMSNLELVLDVNTDHSLLTMNGDMVVDGTDLRIKHRNADEDAPESTTLMNGKLQLTNGQLQMVSGKLQLAGAGNDLGNVGIAFSGNDSQLIVSADTKLGGDIFVNTEMAEEATREHILLTNSNATVTLKSGVYIHAGVVIGNDFRTPEDSGEGTEDEGELLLPAAEEAAPEAPQYPLQPEQWAGTLSVERGEQHIEEGSRLSHVSLHLEAGSRLTIVTAEREKLPELPPVIDEDENEEPSTDDGISLAKEWTEDGFRETEDEPLPEPESDWKLVGLSGEGALASTDEHGSGIDIAVTKEDHHFSGDLTGYQGTMKVLAGNHTQYFDGVTGGKDWNLTNTEGGKVVFNLMGGNKPNHLTMGCLTMESGSETSILFDLENKKTNGNNILTLQGLVVQAGADVYIGQYEGTIDLANSGGNMFSDILGKIDVQNADDFYIDPDSVWHLRGVRNAVNAEVTVDGDGNIHLNAELDNTNYYLVHATNENSAMGAKLMWGITNSAALGGDLARIDGRLSELLKGDELTAGDLDEANRMMAAVAGASTAVLGEAMSADLERQLRAIRNRTTTLSYSGDSYSRLHSGMWINAESNYHKQDADGLLPGYKLNGWGGTVGAHTQMGDSATAGVALTAMYNDLESEGPDRLKGDLDTYYLSAFAQVAHEAWRHTFVMSLGTAQADVNRTVDYTSNGERYSYTTKGSTDGIAFGLMYEVGYTMPMNIDYSVCLQPVFNVSWRMNQMGAYTESGDTNAGLKVDRQTYNALTFGAGARLQAAVGSSLWNRTGIFEGRALLKVDVADRQGVSSVALQSAAGNRGDVKSAEKGAVGLELGAGISLPTGRRGETFVDASAELRADYTNLNATIGYKLSF